MSRHTAGPWEWDGTPWQYDSDNEAPWLMQSPWDGINSKRILGGSIYCESEADARLIAKAPELLEAAELALRFLREDEYPTFRQQLRKLITEITGEEP